VAAVLLATPWAAPLLAVAHASSGSPATGPAPARSPDAAPLSARLAEGLVEVLGDVESGLVSFLERLVAAAPRPPTAATTAARTARPLPRPETDADALAVVSPVGDQTMVGFGASGAWWPHDAIDFAPAVQREIGELLFTPAGIDLSQYRYNIGAGGVGVTDPRKAPETFLVRPGVYDWSRGQAGLLFLRMAAADHVPSLVGFANSAPAFFTSDHKSCGGTLVAADIPAYAQYLADVVAHLHDAWGITLSAVSPMNEPDWSQPLCHQEGMAVPVDERAALVQALGRDLAVEAPYAHVIADESSLVGSELIPELPQWLSVPGTRRYLEAIAHHTYDYPDDATLRAAAALAARFGKPLWATEVCCFDGHGFGWQYDPTMTSGLWLAKTIWADLTQAHDAAFDWWTALSPNLGCDPVADPTCPDRVNPYGRNDGLIYYDRAFRTDHDERLYLTKRFFVLGNFSRYVRPGAVLHEVTGGPDDLRLVAFSDGTRLVVVAVNLSPTGDAPTTLRLELPAGGLEATSAVQTSPTANLAPVAPPLVQGRLASATLPPESVTTFSFAPPPPAGRASGPRLAFVPAARAGHAGKEAA
jgi:O-glycosyl hydrolase